MKKSKYFAFVFMLAFTFNGIAIASEDEDDKPGDTTLVCDGYEWVIKWTDT